MDSQSFNPFGKEIPVEIILLIKNRGLTKHKFHSIKLRVRGIKENERLTEWHGNEPRLYFPDKIIDTEVIFKRKYNYVFVESGVEQTLNYVKLPSTKKLITVRAEFEYDEYKTHSIEKLFELNQNNSKILKPKI